VEAGANPEHSRRGPGAEPEEFWSQTEE